MPFRVFGGTARRIVSPRSDGPLSDWQLVESLTRRGSLLSGSRLPLCRWPNFPGFAVFPRRTLLKTVRFSAVPLCEFCFRLGLCPVPPSFHPAPEALPKLLSWTFAPLQHMQPRRSTDAGFTCPLRSTPRVWLPSRWLAPFKAWPALFHASSALGKIPSERSPHRGRPGRFRPSKLTYRFTQQFLRRPKAPARSDGSRFLSFHPQASPLRPDVCLIHQPPEAPLGLCPSRVRW